MQDPRQTPTPVHRSLNTGTPTRPSRPTNTQPLPEILPTDTETPPIPSASATSTPTFTPEIQLSDTPTPTTQALDIDAPVPTPTKPGSKQPNDPVSPGTSPVPFVVTAVIVVVSSILLAVVTFGTGAGIVAAIVIVAAALIGGAVSSATGGDFWDGFMLGATLAAIPTTLTSFVNNILNLLNKKKRD